MEYKIGTVTKGVVSGLQPYGAFVKLDNTFQGLIHISEVQHGYIREIQGVLKVGDIVEVQVIDRDEYSGKISLSMRTLDKAVSPYQEKRKRYFTNKHRSIGFATLEEAMPKWIEEATEDFGLKKV